MIKVLNRPWKEIVHDLVSSFEEHDSALSMVHPIPESIIDNFVVVNTCNNLLALEGDIDEKAIRQWLWAQRKARAFKRPGALIWAMRWNGKVLVGYGSLTTPEAADRMEGLVRLEMKEL